MADAKKKAIFKKTVTGEGFATSISWAVIGGTRVVTVEGEKIPEINRGRLFALALGEGRRRCRIAGGDHRREG